MNIFKNTEMPEIRPFVPEPDNIPPAVEKFLSTAEKQFNATRMALLAAATQLEEKAAELRRRADQIMTDLVYTTDTVKKAVLYEENCRHVAQSLSLIRRTDGE